MIVIKVDYPKATRSLKWYGIISKANIMGDAKRRKDILQDKYGQETNIFPWLPVTKSQAERLVRWSNRGSWIGIGLLVASWITVRFIGPAFGWWEVN